MACASNGSLCADDPEDLASVLTSLYTDVEAVDAAPTDPQRQVLAEYARRIEASRRLWDALLAKELASVPH